MAMPPLLDLANKLNFRYLAATNVARIANFPESLLARQPGARPAVSTSAAPHCRDFLPDRGAQKLHAPVPPHSAQSLMSRCVKQLQ